MTAETGVSSSLSLGVGRSDVNPRLSREQVRLAVIGAGFWTLSNHLPVLAARRDVEFVSVCDPDPGRMELAQEVFGFPIATDDVGEALDANVDAAIVASPNDLHESHALAAIGRGLNVMVEKPLATTGAGAWRIVEAARLAGVHLLVPYGWHYKKFVRRGREMVAAGALGRIRHIMCHMASPTAELFEGRSGYGSVELAGRRLEASSATWAERAHAGGYAYGQMAHSIGMLCWITGLRAKRVAGRAGVSGTGVDIVDAGWVEFENGAIGVLSGNGIAPVQAGYQLDIRVSGTEGMLLLDIERERCVLYRFDGKDEAVPTVSGEGAYECSDPPARFIELSRGLSTDNPSPGEPAACAVEIIEALLASAGQLGAPVSLEATSGD